MQLFLRLLYKAVGSACYKDAFQNLVVKPHLNGQPVVRPLHQSWRKRGHLSRPEAQKVAILLLDPKPAYFLETI